VAAAVAASLAAEVSVTITPETQAQLRDCVVPVGFDAFLA
jgi:hypothetical protein